MDAETKPKKQQPKYERLILSENALRRVDDWLTQLNEQLKGIKIRRRDLVEYAVLALPEKLSSRNTEEIRKTFFDEIAYAQWAVRELKQAKANGASITLADLISRQNLPKNSAPQRRKKKPASNVIATDQQAPTGETFSKEEARMVNVL